MGGESRVTDMMGNMYKVRTAGLKAVNMGELNPTGTWSRSQRYILFRSNNTFNRQTTSYQSKASSSTRLPSSQA
jgi:hypothetical protein